MCNITAKEYLSQAWRLDEHINTKVQMLSSLNDLALKCTSTISDMPRNPSGTTSRLEDTVLKIISLQEEINTAVDRLVDLKAEISTVISQVPGEDKRLLLEKRYICNLGWDEIAEQLHVTSRYVYKLHGFALIEVQKILDRHELDSK